MRHLNVHNLKKSLDNLCEELNKYWLINSGGCCFVSYVISKYLDRLKIRYKLIIYDDMYKDRDAICHGVINKTKSQYPESSVTGINTCNHYCIHIYGGGTINKGDRSGEHKYIIHGISSTHLKWIYETGSRNPTYDRKNNKHINNIIKSFFRGL